MIIYYLNSRMEKIFNDKKKIQKEFGDSTKVIMRRLSDLDAANCVEDMKNCPGRIEELSADLKEHFSLRLDGNYRLIFKPANDPLPRKEDGGLDWQKITEITIIKGKKDYHGN